MREKDKDRAKVIKGPTGNEARGQSARFVHNTRTKRPSIFLLLLLLTFIFVVVVVVLGVFGIKEGKLVATHGYAPNILTPNQERRLEFSKQYTL